MYIYIYIYIYVSICMCVRVNKVVVCVCCTGSRDPLSLLLHAPRKSCRIAARTSGT